MKKYFSTLKVLLITVTIVFISPLLEAQEVEWAPDFPVGATIPILEAADQDNIIQNLDSLTGTKGLLLVFNRSFDWCPYCTAQLLSLQKVTTDFQASGLEIATITYDPIETLKVVDEDHGITFTMLHDENVRHVNAFGIRNPDYQPDEFAYGIPHPGIMIISPEGQILAKFAEANFRERPDWQDVLYAASKL